MSVENNWTDDSEFLLQKWGEQCIGLHLLHDQASKQMTKLSYFIELPALILAAIVTFLSTNNFITTNSESPPSSSNTTTSLETKQNGFKGVNIAVVVLAGLATIFSTINFFLKPSATAARHLTSSDSFLGISRNIAGQLALKRSDRNPVIEYIKHIDGQFESSMKQSPPIPDNIINKFNKQYGTTSVAKPELSGNLTHININNNNSQIQPDPDSGLGDSFIDIHPPKPISDSNSTSTDSERINEILKQLEDKFHIGHSDSPINLSVLSYQKNRIS